MPPDSAGLSRVREVPHRSADSAIDFLAQRAASSHDGAADVDVLHAAQIVREALGSMEAVQAELTGALIASHDRIMAMEAMAKVNVQGIASDDSIAALLDSSLALTDSRLVVLFHDETVVAFAGDSELLPKCTAIALESIASAPDEFMRNAAADSAMVFTLDPDGEEKRYVAFFRTTGSPFSTQDIPLIETVVSALGLMLAFTELHQRELAQAAVEREHQLASALAQSVITDRQPRSATADIFSTTRPASLTGGDFYVFGESDDSTWFAVGDVAGKGLPAAMLMTRAVAACRVAFLAQRDAGVVEVFRRIEDELFDHLDDAGLFITMTVGVYCEISHTVTLVNAGHSPVVLVQSGKSELIRSSVPPLGIVRGTEPTIAAFALEGDDTLVVGSDGLVEQEDGSGQLFGYEQFYELCSTAGPYTAEDFADEVFSRLAGFANGSAASDDSTLVVIKRSGGSR